MTGKSVSLAASTEARGGNCSILLLDDNVELAEAMKTYLEMERYEVTIVENGIEGLKSIMRSDFDVVVCDLMMPSLSGDKFFQAVEKVKPHLCDRFLFITGFGRSAALSALGGRADGRVIFKPFNMSDLSAAIIGILSQSTLPKDDDTVA
ncbi:MAG: response regulator [Pedosphaera sp.]|nr:response regulator [Pedosphaera sp.]